MEDLSYFVPHVLIQVEDLKKRRIGIDKGYINIRNPETSCNTYNKNGNCDRFTVSLLYAGVTIECIVVFQMTDAECPPDFVFPGEKLFFNLGDIESLREWDAHKSDSLFRALKEILEFYKKKNLVDLEEYPELYFEFISVLEIDNFNIEDIEIYVPQELKKSVKFFIRLNVEFSGILPDSSKIGFAFLTVSFPDRECEIGLYDFEFSEEIKTILTSYGKLKNLDDLPYSNVKRYIRTVEVELRHQVGFIASEMKKKKVFVN